MTEEPAKTEKPLPPSPNPDLGRQLQAAAMSGDPNKALDALVAAGVVSKEQREQMVAEDARAKEGIRVIAAQVANCTEAVRIMAHAMDTWRDGVRGDILKVQREVELIRRSMNKLPGFKDAYDIAKAEVEAREAAQKAKDVAPKSVKLNGVVTSPQLQKSP